MSLTFSLSGKDNVFKLPPNVVFRSVDKNVNVGTISLNRVLKNQPLDECMAKNMNFLKFDFFSLCILLIKYNIHLQRG